MFRFFFFPKDLSKADDMSEMNFVFHSLYHTFYSKMPEDGLKSYLEEFIPRLIQTNPMANFGITQIFEKEAEIFVEN